MCRLTFGEQWKLLLSAITVHLVHESVAPCITLFTARSNYASAVLGIVILSVWRVLCDETEYTADILLPHERVLVLIF